MGMLELMAEPAFLGAVRVALGSSRRRSVGGAGRPHRETAVLTREECARIIDACATGKLALRNQAMMRFLYATGARPSEMLSLRYADIDDGAETVFIRDGKGDLDRYVCIDRETLALLNELRKGKSPGDLVFGPLSLVRLWKILHAAASATGILQKYEALGMRLSPRSFRHAFATHCYENGMGLPTLKKLLGHAFLVTTAIYVHFSEGSCAREYGTANPFALPGSAVDPPQCILSAGVTGFEFVRESPEDHEMRGASDMTDYAELEPLLNRIGRAVLLDELLLEADSDDDALDLAVGEALRSASLGSPSRAAHGSVAGQVDGADDDGKEPSEGEGVGAQILAEFREELGEEVGEANVVMGRLPAVLTRDECAALMSAFTSGKDAERNNLVIRLLYASGMRRAELAHLRFGDISYDSGAVLIRSGKGDKDRYVCLDDKTLEMVRKSGRGQKPGDPVVGATPKIIAEVVEKAGTLTGIAERFAATGRRFSTHSLRHAFATHCYENGMRTLTLKKLLGHKFIATTLIYVYTSTRGCILEYRRTNPFTQTSAVGADSLM